MPDDEQPDYDIIDEDTLTPTNPAQLVLPTGEVFEVIGFGLPKVGQHYVRWNEMDSVGDLVNKCYSDHEADAPLRILLRRVEQPPVCLHPETRTETHTYCATPDGCGECLG